MIHKCPREPQSPEIWKLIFAINLITIFSLQMLMLKTQNFYSSSESLDIPGMNVASILAKKLHNPYVSSVFLID